MKVKQVIQGTNQKPRLSVFRSNNNIYVQAINDQEGKTLLAYSSLNAEMKDQGKNSKSCEMAVEVGRTFGQKLLEKGINQAVFDKGNRLYHGRIKALADGIRESGIVF